MSESNDEQFENLRKIIEGSLIEMGYESTLNVENEQRRIFMSGHNTPTDPELEEEGEATFAPLLTTTITATTADDSDDDESVFMDPSTESYAMQFVIDLGDNSVILWRHHNGLSMCVSAEKFNSEVITVRSAFEWSRLLPFLNAEPFSGEDSI